MKDKATLEAVIEAIENGSAQAEATRLESQPNEPKQELTPEEIEARKKAVEEKLKKRREEIEGMYLYLFYLLDLTYFCMK